MPRQPYPSDLSDAEWVKLKPLLPVERNRIGSPREVELREVVNALTYVADNGIKWRAMPHDFPRWQTVYGYSQRWSRSGAWEQVNQALRERCPHCIRTGSRTKFRTDRQSIGGNGTKRGL